MSKEEDCAAVNEALGIGETKPPNIVKWRGFALDLNNGRPGAAQMKVDEAFLEAERQMLNGCLLDVEAIADELTLSGGDYGVNAMLVEEVQHTLGLFSKHFAPQAEIQIKRHIAQEVNPTYQRMVTEAIFGEPTEAERTAKIIGLLWEAHNHLDDPEPAYAEAIGVGIQLELSEFAGDTRKLYETMRITIAAMPERARGAMESLAFGARQPRETPKTGLEDALIANCITKAGEAVGAERDELLQLAVKWIVKLPQVSQLRWVADVRASLGIDLGPMLETVEAPPTHETPPALDETEKYLALGDILEASKRGEVGHAELFAGLYSGRLKYDHAEGVWYLWSGHHWAPDKKQFAPNLNSNQVAAQYVFAAADAKRRGAEEQAKELWTRAGELRFRNKRANVLHVAAALPAFSMSGEEWDANPWLLGVGNGVVDLRTGTMRPGQPDQFIKSVCPVAWNGLDCPAPRWERFVSEIFGDDAELVGFVHRLFGYGLAGVSTEHILPVLWGEGRNGKDTLLETILSVMGPLASPVSSEVLLDGNKSPNAATPYVYLLRGLRYAWVSETNEGARLDAGQVKLLTGGGTLTGRLLNKNPVKFKPQHTLFLVTNHKPHANSDDFALWKRLILIEFGQTFVENPEGPNERQRDTGLKDTLRAEGPGILAWLVRGCIEWQKNGLRPPQRVLAATEEYKAGEDKLAVFLRECVVEVLNVDTKASELFKRYEAWATSRNEKPMTATAFGAKMGKKLKRSDKNDGRYFVGVGLRAQN